jgi:hypothetical protein
MGSDFIAYIRDQLTNTALVVQMITPEFLSSAFCMCELGAVWASDQDAFPILVPPATHDDLRGILGNVHIEILAQDGIVLDRLHDRVKERLALHPDTAAWNSERAKFIHRLSALLGDVKRRDDARLIRRSIDCLTVDIGATEDVTEFLGTLQGLLTLKGLVDDWWYLHDGYFGIQPSSIEPLDIMDLGLLGVDTVDAVGRTLARRIQDGFVVSSEILGTGQLTGYVPRGHAFASDRARYDVGDESENRVFIVGLAHRQIAIAFHAHFSPPDKLSGLELGEARVRS